MKCIRQVAIFQQRDFDWQEEIASVPSPNDSYDVVVRKVGAGGGEGQLAEIWDLILLMEEILLTSWYGKSPIIYMALYILGGAGFQPSTVWRDPKPQFWV